MFGTYRTILALIIVLIHYANILPLIGHYAVFGFFTLSGFLMTLVVQRNYGYTLKGIVGYALNRLLRIYPLYWTACLFSILVLLYVVPHFNDYRDAVYSLPGTPKEWARNVFLVLRFLEGPALISPAWALTIEVFFYVCIGFGISRNKLITTLWLLASVGYSSFTYFTGVDFTERYATLAAASLPFSIGAAAYCWIEQLRAMFGVLVVHRYAPVFWLVTAFINWDVSSKLGIAAGAGFYVNCGLCAAITLSFYHQKNLFFISRKLDSWLGDLSYPIYLIHFPLAFLMKFVLDQIGLEMQIPGKMFFFLSLPVVLIASWLMAVVVERRVEKLRARIKDRLSSNATI